MPPSLIPEKQSERTAAFFFRCRTAPRGAVLFFFGASHRAGVSCFGLDFFRAGVRLLNCRSVSCQFPANFMPISWPRIAKPTHGPSRRFPDRFSFRLCTQTTLWHLHKTLCHYIPVSRKICIGIFNCSNKWHLCLPFFQFLGLLHHREAGPVIACRASYKRNKYS